jgi:hypothetical protein
MKIVDTTLVRHLLAQQLAAIFVPTPDNIHPGSCPSAGVIACTYARWFQQAMSARDRAPVLHLALPPSTPRLFFQFLLGCSDLPIDTGRRRRPFPIPWLSVSVLSVPPSWSVMSSMSYLSAQH